MKRTATIVKWLMAVSGIMQGTMGILFWTGNALDFVNLHMFLGLAIVLMLWLQAALGLRASAPIWLVGLAFLWGLIVPALGMTQARILPGSLHWIVQVAHLGIGIVAFVLADLLANRVIASRSRVTIQGTTPIGATQR